LASDGFSTGGSPLKTTTDFGESLGCSDSNQFSVGLEFDITRSAKNLTNSGNMRLIIFGDRIIS
jgi:hypothetical protein